MGTYDLLDRNAREFVQRFYRVLPLDAVLDTTPLAILGTQASTNGAVLVRIAGPAGQPFFLQASTDSQNWTDLTSGVLSDDEFDFLDVDAGNYPSRVYRLITP
jgi:hypothetical protein